MNEGICFAGAAELAEKIRSKELSPVEVVRAHLERIETVNPEINAVVTLAEDAVRRAQEAEAALMRGEIRGVLHGVPFTVKDCFDTEGLRTTRGSRIFADHVPKADAVAVQRLRSAGGILLGKTNLPEFALRGETANHVFGRTCNPWNREHTSGGSSGGETAAIASGISPLGIGTDLGGSNRMPAHFCGIVGLKPTHGRIPLTGSWPELMCRHMHAGPIARTVADVALALSVLDGPDNRDPYAVPLSMPKLEQSKCGVAGLSVGFFTEGPFSPVETEIQETVRRAARELQMLGCRVEHACFSWEDRLPIAVAMDLLVAEARRYLRPYVAGREEELTDAIRALLDSPAPSLKGYLDALDKRELLANDVTRFFATHDLLLCPTSPVTAPEHELARLCVDGREVDPGHAASITATFGLTGHPALSLPFGMSSSKLPIGVQLVSRAGAETTLFRAAAALEQRHQAVADPIAERRNVAEAPHLAQQGTR